jgi:hypothetical protein
MPSWTAFALFPGEQALRDLAHGCAAGTSLCIGNRPWQNHLICLSGRKKL